MAGFEVVDVGSGPISLGRDAAVAAFRRGCVIPAHPLALTEHGRVDGSRQRALTRYYLDAGAGGVAVGVHTTQFEIHDNGMLDDVLAISADVVRFEHPGAILIAGVQGSVKEAVADAERAAARGYHLALLRPERDLSDGVLVERAVAVGEVMPTIGFYLQPAVGGRDLSRHFWARLASVDSMVGVKVAAFDPYRTLDVVHGVCMSGRAAEIAFFTGNDNNIVGDLITPYRVQEAGREHLIEFVGGLLGQWAVWTRAAVDYWTDSRAARNGDDVALRRVLGKAAQVTDANAAIFDATNSFRGCIPGIHEVLRRQGLLAGTWCLDRGATLSRGQHDEISRVRNAYPWLADDEFIVDNLSRWMA